MNGTWLSRLRNTRERTGSSVCCGLDLDESRLPTESVRSGPMSERLLDFVRDVVIATQADVCCYKVQKAYVEGLHGVGLQQVVEAVRDIAPETPIILDGKTGDIENTMRAYLAMYLGVIEVDALVLNPYMGSDVWEQMREWPAKAGVVLVRTSNRAGATIQKAKLSDGRELWHLVLEQLVSECAHGTNLIPVMSAMDHADLRFASQELPPEIPIFVAGVGAQGGHAQGLQHVVGKERILVVNSSRSLIFSYEPNESSWRSRIARATADLKAQLVS